MVRGGRDEGVSNKKYLKNYENIFSKENIFTSRHPFNFKISTNERLGKQKKWSNCWIASVKVGDFILTCHVSKKEKNMFV